jgi:hypothetical protein
METQLDTPRALGWVRTKMIAIGGERGVYWFAVERQNGNSGQNLPPEATHAQGRGSQKQI